MTYRWRVSLVIIIYGVGYEDRQAYRNIVGPSAAGESDGAGIGRAF